MPNVRKVWSYLLATVASLAPIVPAAAMPVENPAVANQFDVELVSGGTTAPFTQATPGGGLYNVAQSVTLRVTPHAIVTTDGQLLAGQQRRVGPLPARAQH